MLKAMFFDVDDTLCDRSGVLEECLRMVWAFIEDIHPSLFVFDDFAKVYKHYSAIYLPRQETFRLVLKSRGIEDEELGVKLADLYSTFMDSRVRLFDGAIEVLSILKQDLVLGIISNAPSESQLAKIIRLGIAPHFDVIVISSEIGIAKPDPRIFHRATELGNVEPHEAAYVGDDEQLDIAGAKRASLLAIWANMHRRKYDGSTEPDFEIHQLRELLNISRQIGVRK